MRVVVVVALVVGCYRSSSRAPQPIVIDQTPRSDQRPAEPVRTGDMYALDEVLADVFSGPLVHVGTGPWFGLFRINVCLYRNERVFVVNMYCTTKEMNAFAITVFSPTRGRAYIYAEAEKPISTLQRADYFTFKAETHPPLPPEKLAPVSLAFTLPELNAWQEKRYYKWGPGCWGGVEIRNPQGGCLKPLEAHAPAWKKRNQAFLDNPPRDWYRIVREMRARAKREGKHVSNPGG